MENILRCDSSRSIIKLMMAEIHLAALASGSWHCGFWLAVMANWYTSIKESLLMFPLLLQVPMSALKAFY